jgi:hypothetical protein
MTPEMDRMDSASASHAQATYPRYVAAIRRGGSYVVYDRWDARVADGCYLTLTDAQWAADQRNQTTTTRQIDEAC